VLGLLEGVTAGLFGLDGVLTNAVAVHNKASTELFGAFLRERAERTGKPFVGFAAVADCSLYIGSEPRLDGVRDFLASRGVTLPEGDPRDGPGVETAYRRRGADIVVSDLAEQLDGANRVAAR
jgi:beta-phosphoglucomutase-like phosphatase (HAD superfamily)